MKQLINKYFILALLSTAFISCDSDNFLEEPAPTDSVTDVVLYSTVGGIEAAMTGTYAVLRTWYSSHDTSTNAAYYLGAEVMGADLTVPDFNWMIFEHRWDAVDSANSRRAGFAWEMYYSVASDARLHIRGITASNAVSEAQKAIYIAELQAFEAHCYFNILRVYSHSYLMGSSLPGVPVYEVADFESTGNPRGTIQETYDKILNLLLTAIPNMQTTAPHKFRFNKSVAQGVLARVYLEMGMYPEAAAAANAAKVGYPLMNAAEYSAGFNDYSQTEWMWGMPYNAEQTYFVANFYSMIDHSSGGYETIWLSTDFVNTFDAGDMRRDLILDYDPGNPFKNYVTVKFVDLPDHSGHNIMMRASEMWMIEAEALAYSDLPAAKLALLEVLQARTPGATLSTAANAADFVDEVLLERRKEFYGELGLGFFDLKRHNQGLVRTGPNQRWPITVPAGDSRWTQLIPQDEIDKNPLMSESDQN
jgi:hypothetical protein